MYELHNLKQCQRWRIKIHLPTFQYGSTMLAEFFWKKCAVGEAVIPVVYVVSSEHCLCA